MSTCECLPKRKSAQFSVMMLGCVVVVATVLTLGCATSPEGGFLDRVAKSVSTAAGSVSDGIESSVGALAGNGADIDRRLSAEIDKLYGTNSIPDGRVGEWFAGYTKWVRGRGWNIVDDWVMKSDTLSSQSNSELRELAQRAHLADGTRVLMYRTKDPQMVVTTSRVVGVARQESSGSKKGWSSSLRLAAGAARMRGDQTVGTPAAAAEARLMPAGGAFSEDAVRVALLDIDELTRIDFGDSYYEFCRNIERESCPDVPPLSGYGKAKWGTSVEDVRAMSWGREVKYSDEWEGLLNASGTAFATGMNVLAMEGDTPDGTRRCVYYFLDGKLAIAVYFPPESLSDNGKAIIDALTMKYGVLTKRPADESEALRERRRVAAEQVYRSSGMTLEASECVYSAGNATGGVRAVCTIMKLGALSDTTRREAAKSGDSDDKSIGDKMESLLGQRPDSEKMCVSGIVYFAGDMQAEIVRRNTEVGERKAASDRRMQEEQKVKAAQGL
jgi:hypothetical protein